MNRIITMFSATTIVLLVVFSTTALSINQLEYNNPSGEQDLKTLDIGSERVLFGRFTNGSGYGWIETKGGWDSFISVIPQPFFKICTRYNSTIGDGSVTLNGVTRQGDYDYTIWFFIGSASGDQIGYPPRPFFIYGFCLLVKITKL